MNIDESTKITLTISQLKRLVKESRLNESAWHFDTDTNSVIAFHSTGSKEELSDILLKGEYKPGKHGTMLGPGFYGNLDIEQTRKGNYGDNMLKARVFGLNKFFFVNYEAFKKCFGTPVWKGVTVDRSNFIDMQKRRFGWDGENRMQFAKFNQRDYERSEGDKYSNAWIVPILKNGAGINAFKNHFLFKPYGIVYHGNWDSDSIVCWSPKECVKPIAVALNTAGGKGEKWIPATEITAGNLEDYGATSVRTPVRTRDFSGGTSEVVRSSQRAYDILDAVKNLNGEERADRMIELATRQLGAIRDRSKFDIRKSTFLDVFGNNDDVDSDVVDAVKYSRFNG